MKRYVYGLGLLAAGWAAAFVLVYLYRWEWNRAAAAMGFLLLGEVGLLGAFLQDRLRRVEALVGASAQPGWRAAAQDERSAQALAALRRTAPRPYEPFAWMRPSPHELSVFVPLLLGAGVILSGLAWVVERLARATARHGLERGLADRLAPLSLPPGGPFGAPARAADPWSVAPGDSARLRRRMGRRAAAGVAGVGLAVPAFTLLADRTETRPDPARPEDATVLVLESSEHNRRPAEVSARVDALWRFCVATRLAPADSDVVHAAGQRYVAVVAPALGEHALRRFRGCLQDSAVDYVQLRVVAITDAAADSGIDAF